MGIGRTSKLKDALAVYGEPRVLAMLFLGFSSGLPLALTASTLTAWLENVGLSLTLIGLFAVVATPYSLKFLWSPFVDRLRLPLIGRWLGHRRGWIVVVQIALMAAIAALGLSDPAADIKRTAILALLVAFLSATQDILIDAYRVESLRPDQFAAGAATATFGYRLGMLVAGGGGLILADHLSWPLVYLLMAAIQGVGLVAVLVNPEPPARGQDTLAAEAATADRLFAGSGSGARKVLGWLYVAVVAPFHEFMTRNGVAVALTILAFVICFKVGDALAGMMTTTFLLKIGFTKTEIGEVVKGFGLFATFAGFAAGGALMRMMGLFRALLVCGVVQMGSNLLFAVQAAVGAKIWMLVITIGLENMASGMGSAVFIAYLSGLCNLAFTATQYALLSSLAVVGRTWLSAGSGAMAEALGWVDFFLVTTVAAVPGILLLFVLRRMGLGLTPAAAKVAQ